MASPKSITEIDLDPIPGKEYWNADREWREEFIYFLMVDRFHDDQPRQAGGRLLLAQHDNRQHDQADQPLADDIDVSPIEEVHGGRWQRQSV